MRRTQYAPGGVTPGSICACAAGAAARNERQASSPGRTIGRDRQRPAREVLAGVAGRSDDRMIHSAPFMAAEHERRRTFAIISHPDAGKTTLTEKMLLYGGAIHMAGAVKSRKAERAATSDWMELEKKRGISITSSVLQFEHVGIRFNLLDTPGHQDFSEDTYRTLTAADCAIMLIDAAKGVEAQTRKLFHVCRMRGTPVVTFVNKMDRPGRDPFELMSEVEEVLGLHTVPITWPIGSGDRFQGVYHRGDRTVQRFERTEKNATRAPLKVAGIDDPELDAMLGEEAAKELREGVDLLDGA